MDESGVNRLDEKIDEVKENCEKGIENVRGELNQNFLQQTEEFDYKLGKIKSEIESKTSMEYNTLKDQIGNFHKVVEQCTMKRTRYLEFLIGEESLIEFIFPHYPDESWRFLIGRGAKTYAEAVEALNRADSMRLNGTIREENCRNVTNTDGPRMQRLRNDFRRQNDFQNGSRWIRTPISDTGDNNDQVGNMRVISRNERNTRRESTLNESNEMEKRAHSTPVQERGQPAENYPRHY
ncbi:hypothetical protein FQA39_LY06820 [Lamprigera yunnana]|nr:hypothetical protein FQA39_LY06820 [Lamprigera yunnana]